MTSFYKKIRENDGVANENNLLRADNIPKQVTLVLPITSPNVDRFSKLLH